MLMAIQPCVRSKGSLFSTSLACIVYRTKASNPKRLSLLRTGRLNPPPQGNIPDTHFCYRLSQPQGHSAAGRIMSMKNSNDTIGNRTRDLPVVALCLNQLHHRAPHRELPANKMLQMHFNTSIPVSGHCMGPYLPHMLPASVHRTDVNAFKGAVNLKPLTWNGVGI